MYFVFKFLSCLILNEIKMIFTKLSYLNYFLFNISFFKYIFYLFNKNINPVRSNKFSNFIKLNKKKWIEQEDKKNSNISNSVVLVENFVNHPETFRKSLNLALSVGLDRSPVRSSRSPTTMSPLNQRQYYFQSTIDF